MSKNFVKVDPHNSGSTPSINFEWEKYSADGTAVAGEEWNDKTVKAEKADGASYKRDENSDRNPLETLIIPPIMSPENPWVPVEQKLISRQI